MKNKDLKRLSKMLSPEQQAAAETMATLKVERNMFKKQAEILQEQHSELWQLIVVLFDQAGTEIRIQKSHFTRLFESYKLNRSFDDETQEYIFDLDYNEDTDAPTGNFKKDNKSN